MKPIGVFDSGFGGLTILKEIEALLPQYDYIYLGDNARAPYGVRSFETVYNYTLEAVKWLFKQNCHLIIIACNTASSKALRSIQQNYITGKEKDKRVLGVIRPITESIGNYTNSKHIGILATPGTVESGSYVIEIKKFFPEIVITQEASPMWVPLVEYGEAESEGADYFVKKHIENLLKKDPLIDTIILGCTHYPLLEKKIKKFLPPSVKIISQGPIVAQSLKNYLLRHPEIESNCSKNKIKKFYTSEKTTFFNTLASLFYGKEIECEKVIFW